jgi:two-component system NtrC family sensor kinase
MVRKNQITTSDYGTNASYSEELRLLSRQILQMANSGLTRTHFLRRILKIILESFNADEVSILTRNSDDPSRYEKVRFNQETFGYGIIGGTGNGKSVGDASPGLFEHWTFVLSGEPDCSLPFMTEKGSVWIRDPDDLTSGKGIPKQLRINAYLRDGNFKSLLTTPFIRENERIGLLEMKSRKERFLPDIRIGSIETFIHTLGMTILNQHTQAALQERVKELTCLYSMSQIADKPYVSLENLIPSIMELLPPAWQYPEITRTRIILDGAEYSLAGYKDDADKLSSDIEIDGRKRGKIEVIYTRDRPLLDEGPFLKEERKLLDVIAKELAHILKRRETEEDKAKILNQLHHADRLTTVGELAAGVAHEINEPLGSILGFAQLAGKYPEVPDQVKKDLAKIVSASLHAREIVKKMMVYSRQVVPEKKEISLNQVIEDSLYFIKSRCIKEGIELRLYLDPALPAIVADPVQINQVVVNIVVNAMQAMPGGGTLSIRSESTDHGIRLTIKDTGQGMDEEIRKQIFNPFFTTKGAGVGLGLGLSVVEGIIKSHGGEITVSSAPGKGSEFIINLPAGNSIATDPDEQ